MSESLDFYDRQYEGTDAQPYRAIRAETFGVDLGQESWLTVDECDRFCDWLQVGRAQRVLEVACGTGGVARHLAERTGAEVVGVDVNELAIRAARQRAAAAPDALLHFQTADANAPLPFADRSFDALFCNDAINHLHDRRAVLREWSRVLRPGGRCVFTDPVVVTGLVSNAELAARSAIGFFVFSLAGANEALLRESGFEVERTANVTDGVVQTAERWRRARARRRDELAKLESEPRFDGIQRFLTAVHTLASERRLSRFAFVGRRA